MIVNFFNSTLNFNIDLSNIDLSDKDFYFVDKNSNVISIKAIKPTLIENNSYNIDETSKGIYLFYRYKDESFNTIDFTNNINMNYNSKTYYGGYYNFTSTPNFYHSFTSTAGNQSTVLIYNNAILSEINKPSIIYNIADISELNNCIIEPETITKNTETDIKIHTFENYVFNNVPKITIDNIEYQFTLENDYYIYRYSNGNINSIIAIAEEYIEEVETIDLLSIADLQHCIIEPIEITKNKKINITLTCENGYTFQFTPLITIDGYTHDFSKNDDNNIAYYEYTNGNITKINGIGISETKIEENYGLITLYKPDKEVLKDLPELVLYQDKPNNQDTNIVDIPKYIVNYFTLPLDIETNEFKYMSFGGNISGLQCRYINDNEYEIDFGNIDLTGFYQNLVDYESEVNIYLPYLNTITLPTDKVIDKTINLVYRIDLLTGLFIAIIKSNNVIIHSVNGKMSKNIPYINTDKEYNSLVNGNLDGAFLMNDKVPKIIFNSKTMIENIVNSKTETVKLDTLSGFNSIENLQIVKSDNMLSSDIDQIKNILSNGIIF